MTKEEMKKATEHFKELVNKTRSVFDTEEKVAYAFEAMEERFEGTARMIYVDEKLNELRKNGYK